MTGIERFGGGAGLHDAGQSLGHQIHVVGLEHAFGGGRSQIQVLARGAFHTGHDVQGRLFSLVGERGICAGHIFHRERVVTEHGERFGTVERCAFHACGAGGFRDLLRAELGLQIHEHGVRRHGRRTVQVDVTVVLIAEVAHGAGDAGESAIRVAVEHGVEAYALLHRRKQCERLHRGTDLILRLRGVVVLLGQIIIAGVYGKDRPVLRVGAHRTELHAVRYHAGHTVIGRADDLLHQILLVLVDGGNDLVTAGVQIVRGERLGIHQFAAHHLQQVTVRPLVDVLQLCVLHGGGKLGLLRLLAGDIAILMHDVDDALETRFGLLLIHRRIPVGRGGDDAGQHRGFVKRQILGVLIEVSLSRRLDAVCAAAQVNGVHVIAQHLILVLRLRDFQCEDGLPDLALVTGGFAQIIPFRILLGDGGTALARAFGQIVDERTGDAPDVDAVVLVEGAVLGGDDGVAHVFRQGIALDDGAVLLGEGTQFRDAVVVVHGGVFRHGDLFGLRDLRGDVQVGEQADASEKAGSDQAEHPLEDEMLAAAFQLRAFAVGAMVTAAIMACGGRIGCRVLLWSGAVVRTTGSVRSRETGASSR